MFHFNELSRRHGDFAVVGIGVKAVRDQARVFDIEAVIFGSEPKPLIVACPASIEPDCSDETLRNLARDMTSHMEPMANHQGSPETKRQQAAVLLQRGLADLRAKVPNV